MSLRSWKRIKANKLYFSVVGSCSFEERSFCGWGSDPRTDYDWGIDSGSGSNWPLSGPMYDHTYQSLQGIVWLFGLFVLQIGKLNFIFASILMMFI